MTQQVPSFWNLVYRLFSLLSLLMFIFFIIISVNCAAEGGGTVAQAAAIEKSVVCIIVIEQLAF